jgi:TolB protein
MLQKYRPSSGDAHPDASARLPGWLKWLIGAVTVLAGGILILALVLGVRAGQQQLEIQNRQQIGIQLQRALDHRAAGDVEGALEAYRRVLLLDPGNSVAADGIEALMGDSPVDDGLVDDGLADDGAVAESADAAAPAVSAPPSVPATTPTDDPLTTQWNIAQEAYDAGRWKEAVDQLRKIRAIDSDYRVDYLTAMLYNSYFNLAVESDRINRSEEALNYLEQAMALQPNANEARQLRDVVSTYLEVLSLDESDLEQMVDSLQRLYELDSGYRDVRERLQRSHMQYGDELVQAEEWCSAARQYNAAIAIQVTPGAISKRDTYQTLCVEGGGDVDDEAIVQAPGDTNGAAAGRADAAPADAADEDETAAGDASDDAVDAASGSTAGTGAATGAPSGGRILYSARNPGDNRMRIFAQPLGGSASPTVLVEDATQPALRSDGQRLAYRNMLNDSIGISSFDPGSGLRLRFTQYSEDALPSWSPDGNRVVFASNREGDRRWRVYAVWAEEGGATQSFGFGEAPAWHPSADRIVFRGCDEQGNQCGLWTMNGNGGERGPLTTVPGDTRPTWSPDGRYVVFMSSARDGNWDLYRVPAGGGSALRLTDNPASDVLPTVSPDGGWVAFLSNRNGAWELWAVSIDGGSAQKVADVTGDIGSWLEQDIQWVP